MEQEKNNTFSWVLRFATQCKGKMAASVLLAVLGSVCGIVPYFAVSQIVIQICGQNYDLIPIGFWALAALLGYLGSHLVWERFLPYSAIARLLRF